MLRSRFVLLPWAVLLACGFLVLGADHANAEEVLASWYGPDYLGLPTASGEPYDASGYTASHKSLPFGTPLEVSYGGKSVQVTVNDRGPFTEDRGLDLSQAAAEELGLTGAGVDYVDVDYPSDVPSGVWNDTGPTGDYSSYAEGSTGPEASGQTKPPIGTTDTPLEVNQANGLGYAPFSPAYSEGGSTPSIPAPGTTREEASGGLLGAQNGLPQVGSAQGTVPGATAPYVVNDQDFVAQPNGIGTGAASPVQPYGVDSGFVGHQEGFRLDAYVPDPLFSMSGVTVGTGVDVGQRSAADIQALDIPEGLKQKLIPYAGLKGQDAVNFLANRPLRLSAEEAYALDTAVAHDIFGDVATLYDAASEDSFLELPLEARTAIGDLAYQYGPNLAQRTPDFWGDVTQGRWDEATQTLKDFGDRYPDRRNEEAALLEQAIGRGDLASYLVQPGDTLSGVASRQGISPEYLAARNGVPDPDVIYGGQPLFY